MHQNKIYIGSNLLHIFKVLKDRKNNIPSILVESNMEIGGAWKVHTIKDRIITEMGGHILYKDRFTFYKLKLIYNVSIKLLKPQPQVKLGDSYVADDKLSVYMNNKNDDNIILSLIKVIKYLFERLFKGSHFYFESGVIPFLTDARHALDQVIVHGSATQISKLNRGYRVYLADGNFLDADNVEISRGSLLKKIVGMEPKYDSIKSRNVFFVTDGRLNINGFVSFGIPTYAQLGKKSEKSNVSDAIRLVRLSELSAYSSGLLANENVYCVSILCSDATWADEGLYERIFLLLVQEKFAKTSDAAKILFVDKVDYTLNRMQEESISALKRSGVIINDVTDMANAIRKYL